jgi:riboflavin biosynthesis pyrimidine reductase
MGRVTYEALARFAASATGLIDRIRLMVFPLILGETGREPIFVGYPRLPLELVSTKVLDSRLVLHEYHPATGVG